jgi:hypothetical protein
VDFTKGFWKLSSKWEILRKITIIPWVKNKVSDMIITQKYNIRDQLAIGCKALDIRVSYKDNIFYTNHTFCCGKLEDTLCQINEYVLENLVNLSDSSESIILLIKPDWETRSTIINHETELLDLLVKTFGNLLKNKKIICYFKPTNADVLKNYVNIYNFNSLDFIWLNVDTVQEFKDKFNQKCKSKDLSNSIVNFVLTMDADKFNHNILNVDLKKYAKELNPLGKELLSNCASLPMIVLFDFIDNRLFDDISKII